MISTRISGASAVFLLIGGIALLFGSDEILPRLIPSFPVTGSWIGQLLGAGWLALAALNWTSRSALLGGIYGRPLVVANLSLYFVSAMVLLKVVVRGEISAGPTLILVPAALFAIVYGGLLLRGPIARDFEIQRGSL